MVDCLNKCGPMEEKAYESVEIDHCPLCKGVWLDFGELTNIIETKYESWPHDLIEKVLATTGEPGVPQSEMNRDLRCPDCGDLLPPNNYQNSSGIIVNACHKKHGIWLDRGELVKLQIYMEKWDVIAKENSKEYQNILAEIEKEHDRKYSEKAPNGPSSFDVVNVFLEKLAGHLK